MTSKPVLVGLNLFRAVAILLMIFAHSARLQTNLTAISLSSSQAGIVDQWILFVLKIEPMISAMFLFIAGFSLVLSHSQKKESAPQWLARQTKRAVQLYLIAIVFYLGDQGLQWPDTLVSPGILEVIAVALMVAALCLNSRYPMQSLFGLSIAGTVLTAILEQTRSSIPGLNAGAGGMFPLITLAWLGALTGLIRARWPRQGLQVMFGASLLTGLFALSNAYPWITQPTTTLEIYPGDRVQSVLYSMQDWIGMYAGEKQLRMTVYWNHSSIFPWRALPLLIALLWGFLTLFKPSTHPVIRYFHWMGGQALNLYILHLLLLAPLEVLGVKPASGWQTLLVVLGIIAMAPWILRYLSFVPWRVGRPPIVPA